MGFYRSMRALCALHIRFAMQPGHQSNKKQPRLELRWAERSPQNAGVVASTIVCAASAALDDQPLVAPVRSIPTVAVPVASLPISIAAGPRFFLQCLDVCDDC